MSSLKERFNTICKTSTAANGSQPSAWLSDTMDWVSSNSKKLLLISSLSLCCAGSALADSNILTSHTAELGRTYLQTIIPDINVVIGEIQDLAIANSETQEEVNMHIFQKNAANSSLSAAVLSDKVHFNKQHTATSGPITCYLSVNKKLFDADFLTLKQYSKLSDDKLLDLYARHELAHCMQHGSEYKALTKYHLTGESSSLDAPVISSSLRKTALNNPRNISILEENLNDYAVQIRENAPCSVLEVVSTEVYADSMALISAYVDGAITKEEAYDYLNIRKLDYAAHTEELHNTYEGAKELFESAIASSELIDLKALGSTSTKDNIPTVFKIVQKQWAQIIQSPEFIERHDIEIMSMP